MCWLPTASPSILPSAPLLFLRLIPLAILSIPLSSVHSHPRSRQSILSLSLQTFPPFNGSWACTLFFYRRFLSSIAHVLCPLTDACARLCPSTWTTAMETSFQTTKSILVSAVPLDHSSPVGELSLATDVFNSHA